MESGGERSHGDQHLKDDLFTNMMRYSMIRKREKAARGKERTEQIITYMREIIHGAQTIDRRWESSPCTNKPPLQDMVPA